MNSTQCRRLYCSLLALTLIFLLRTPALAITTSEMNEPITVQRWAAMLCKGTLHEFGHFLDSVLGVPSESCFFYEAEAGAASAFLRAYAGTSCREYFADYFSYYVTNYDDTEKAAQMERLTLETFAFFSQMEAGGWQL